MCDGSQRRRRYFHIHLRMSATGGVDELVWIAPWTRAVSHITRYVYSVLTNGVTNNANFYVRRGSEDFDIAPNGAPTLGGMVMDQSPIDINDGEAFVAQFDATTAPDQLDLTLHGYWESLADDEA